MLLLLLLDLGPPVITDVSVLKKKNNHMTNAKNNTLTKTTKEQHGFGAALYSGCVWLLHQGNSGNFVVKLSLHLTILPSLLLCNIKVIYLSI